MKFSHIVFFLIVFLVFGFVNFYIGYRGWQAARTFHFVKGYVYWTVFWLIALSYIAGRAGGKILPVKVSSILGYIGSYWMAAMFYFILIFVLIDFFRLLNRWIRVLPESVKDNPLATSIVGAAVLTLVISILIYGAINSRKAVVNKYEVTIDKKTAINTLTAVMVSDVHLGDIIHSGRLKDLVDKVNGIEPDVILFAGDIVDGEIKPFIDQNMSELFMKLKAKYGVYAVFGNHEYYGGNVEEIEKALESSGICILRDEYVKINGSFYIVGREDRAAGKRKSLEELLTGVDKSLPIILLDHQPYNLDDAKRQGVDLQLSGHTHRGQMFPNNFITERIYEIDWGYLKKNNLNVIVSSGFGTWGPPIRTGSTSEIVDIRLNFR